jgi:hypothetical protein
MKVVELPHIPSYDFAVSNQGFQYFSDPDCAQGRFRFGVVIVRR